MVDVLKNLDFGQIFENAVYVSIFENYLDLGQKF